MDDMSLKENPLLQYTDVRETLCSLANVSERVPLLFVLENKRSFPVSRQGRALVDNAGVSAPLSRTFRQQSILLAEAFMLFPAKTKQ